MSTLSSLFCLLLGSASTVGLLWFLVNRGLRQINVTTAYREVSGQLGLSVDTRGTSVHGHLGDRRIWIGQVLVGHGHDRRHAHWGILDLERPLGLGFLLRRRGMSERLFRSSRSPSVETGHASFDKRVEVRAAEPEKARALLTDDVVAAIEEVLSEWPDIVIADRAVRVHLRREEGSARRVMRLVNSMMRVATALEAARAHIDPPEPLALIVPRWTALAKTLAVDVEPWLPALSGSLAQRRLVVAPTRGPDGGYSAVLYLYFGPHRDTGLRIKPQREPDGYWSVGQDIQFADAPFDRAFVIKGYDPERIQQMLGPEVRAALLALNELGALEVDDRMLHLRRLSLDEEPIRTAVAQASAVADRLGW